MVEEFEDIIQKEYEEFKALLSNLPSHVCSGTGSYGWWENILDKTEPLDRKTEQLCFSTCGKNSNMEETSTISIDLVVPKGVVDSMLNTEITEQKRIETISFQSQVTAKQLSSHCKSQISLWILPKNGVMKVD